MTDSWRRLPLRAQLTAVFAALLVVGLVLSGVTAHTLLRQSMITQLDEQLTAATPRLVRLAAEGLPDPGQVRTDDGLPSDYHAVFSTRGGEIVSRWSTGAPGEATPDIPALTVDEVAALDGQAFTVGSSDGGPWRVLARTIATTDGTAIGSVAAALPMTAVEATSAHMRRVLVLIGVTVVVLGALAGSWAVRRSLRPLAEIEQTAAAIADGDLTRRVPDAPSSTEVGRLATALNGMLAQIEQAFDARTASEQRMRQFVADASHELRTPLAAIRGYGELYRMGALTTPEEVARTIGRMEDSATRMGTLVEDLLHLARLDESRGDRRAPVDLTVLAGDAAADLRALDPERPVRLEPLEAGGSFGQAVVLGDEDRLRQVLANLIGNVVRHTPDGTPVELAVGRTGPEGRHVALEVRDHGPGIDPAHAGRVFERFYRVDAARGRESGGAGLGMAIVAAIVAAHDGTVDLSATPGGGTTVRVVLPAAATSGAEPTTAREP